MKRKEKNCRGKKYTSDLAKSLQNDWAHEKLQVKTRLLCEYVCVCGWAGVGGGSSGSRAGPTEKDSSNGRQFSHTPQYKKKASQVQATKEWPLWQGVEGKNYTLKRLEVRQTQGEVCNTRTHFDLRLRPGHKHSEHTVSPQDGFFLDVVCSKYLVQTLLWHSLFAISISVFFSF